MQEPVHRRVAFTMQSFITWLTTRIVYIAAHQ